MSHHFALDSIQRRINQGMAEEHDMLLAIAEMLDDRLLAIVGGLESLRLAVAGDLERPSWIEPEECRMHTCDYFGHYLAYGPADLTHEGFHSAARHCDEAQKAGAEHIDTCERCARAPERCEELEMLNRRAERWEERVRA